MVSIFQIVIRNFWHLKKNLVLKLLIKHFEGNKKNNNEKKNYLKDVCREDDYVSSHLHHQYNDEEKTKELNEEKFIQRVLERLSEKKRHQFSLTSSTVQT